MTKRINFTTETRSTPEEAKEIKVAQSACGSRDCSVRAYFHSLFFALFSVYSVSPEGIRALGLSDSARQEDCIRG